MSSAYESVIGLEIHSQLMTNSKAFCFAPAEFGADENTKVGPVSAGLPGALPVLNAKAVELAVRAGVCLNCEINKVSVFSRKNYFYPDLPKGYQISQFDLPLCGPGWVEILVGNKFKKINIERIHMEEDAGKSTHTSSATLVNLNRSGVPLVEIVTKPEIANAVEAVSFMKAVHSMLTFAHVTDGNMEEGNFRCDVNISIRPIGETKLGTRAEIKNINSFRFVEKAIEYEKARQIALVQNGGKVVQETRGWDPAINKTFTLRSKEDAHDYRYFPDPDLPPLIITDEYIKNIKENTPELPQAKRTRFQSVYSLSEYDANQLTAKNEISSYFEACIKAGAPAKQAANWILSELLALIKEGEENTLENTKLSPEHLVELISLIENKTISGKIAKQVFTTSFQSGESPKEIVSSKGLAQVSDNSAVEAWVNQVVKHNADSVLQYQQGSQKVFSFLVGQVMKISKGKANPALVSNLLKKAIDP